MVYEDPRWLAEAVAEFDRLSARLYEVARELCRETRTLNDGSVLCNNSYAYADRELGEAYKKLYEAASILQKKREDFMGRLKKAVVLQIIDERVNEYIKLAKQQGW